MIGRLIRAYRWEKKISQADLASLMKAAGCEMPNKKICRLENEAAKGKVHGRLSDKEITTLQRVTGIDMAILRFLNGEIPKELQAAKDLTLSQIRTGMAMLYAACGLRDQGPAITHDVAVRMRLIEEIDTPKDELRAYKRLLRQGKALPDEAEMAAVGSVQKGLAGKIEEPSAMEKLLEKLGFEE